MTWMLIGCPLVCLGVCCPLFFYYKPRNPFLGACFKSLGTVCALLPGVITAMKLDPLYWIVTIALALCAGADFIIEYSFMAGMGVFLLGHLCYAVAFLQLFPASVTTLILFLLMAACLAVFIWSKRKVLGKSLLPFSVYGAALVAVLSISLSGGLNACSLQGAFIALGSALFFFSDLLLFRTFLQPSAPRPDLVIMVTYYLAQLLYGLSGFFR